MNLPNKLTLLRILLIPVFMVFAGLGGFAPSYLIAGAVFAFASFTDYLDGHIARKRNLVTDFGKFADPLADKALTTVAFIYMAMDGICHPVVLCIIVLREFAVSGVRMVAASAQNGTVIAANMWGKVKTVSQMTTIIFYYFIAGFTRMFGAASPNSADLWQCVSFALCWVVAATTALSGIQYIWGNRRYINTAR